MTASLAGKIAVVTAAAQGIGRASAEALARAGAKVYATDIAMDRLAELRDAPGLQTERLDVLSPKDIRAFGSRIPRGEDIPSIAPASSIPGRFWSAPRRTGASRLTSTSALCFR